MRITKTAIGDVFSTQLNEESKKFFQYIVSDLTQLNSDVIRAFKRIYPLDFQPNLSEIVNDEVDFYAHCDTKHGVKLKLWEKVGNVANVGDFTNIIFRDTEDYGIKLGEEPILISNTWYVWKVNGSFSDVGKVEGKNRDAYVGLVINPYGIVELLKGNKYPHNYPAFE